VNITPAVTLPTPDPKLLAKPAAPPAPVTIDTPKAPSLPTLPPPPRRRFHRRYLPPR